MRKCVPEVCLSGAVHLQRVVIGRFCAKVQCRDNSMSDSR